MALPTVTQTWTFSINNRYVFTGSSTLITTMGAYILSLKNFLKTTMGYTVKGSCDGTTGAMDGVDRITDATKWATRATVAGASQSWVVLTDGAGIDWLWAYQSTGDDISRLSHSTGGNYVAAGTPAQQPTATDECFDAASITWINATTSIDRVWHFMASSDKKMWRSALYRSSVLISYIKGEKFTSSLIAPATFTLATGGGTQGAIKSFYNGQFLPNNVGSAYTSSLGDVCRLHTNQDINCKAGNGGEMLGGTTAFSVALSAEKPALQGNSGELIFPTQLGSVLASADGKLGAVIDQWFTYTNSTSVPVAGDTFGALQFFVVAPGLIVPLDGINAPATA